MWSGNLSQPFTILRYRRAFCLLFSPSTAGFALAARCYCEPFPTAPPAVGAPRREPQGRVPHPAAVPPPRCGGRPAAAIGSSAGRRRGRRRRSRSSGARGGAGGERRQRPRPPGGERSALPSRPAPGEEDALGGGSSCCPHTGPGSGGLGRAGSRRAEGPEPLGDVIKADKSRRTWCAAWRCAPGGELRESELAVELLQGNRRRFFFSGS